MESMHGTGLGWLLAGMFLGWLGNWLFDMLYRRDGRRAGELTELQMQGLQTDLDRLRDMLAERDARLDAMHAALGVLTQRLSVSPGSAVGAEATGTEPGSEPVPESASRSESESEPHAATDAVPDEPPAPSPRSARGKGVARGGRSRRTVPHDGT